MPNISVTSRPESFRRAGIRFTRTPTIVKNVDEKSLKTLAGEPNLNVKVLPDEPESPPSGAKPKLVGKTEPKTEKTPKPAVK